MIDLSKLSPAPWAASSNVVHSGHATIAETYPMCFDDALFVALARNAFDVMMRRGWSVLYCRETRQWFASERGYPNSIGGIAADDPFTVLVEADRWYKKNA